MKLLVSVLAALSAGCLVYGLAHLAESTSRPDPDFISQALRKAVGKLLSRNLPAVSRYVQHITPMFNEIARPPTLDFPLFLALHGVIGLPVWIVAAYALPGAALYLLPVCIGVGAVLPYFWLKTQQGKFHTALLKSLPDCLELQALVMEAGLDLNAGLQNYLDKGTPSPLQGLLKGVQKEIQMGRSRCDAFSSLAGKTTYYPLRDVCRGIVQAITLGSSLAPLMREQATALRIKRMQVAEKKAAEAPLKILFPLFVFIFPTIFMVLLGPMAIMFMRGGF